MTPPCGHYAAAFALDDPDALVDAALSCPMCLGADTRVEIGIHGEVVTGGCVCDDCGATWSLGLEPQQLLRLALDPPRGTAVTFSSGLPLPLLPPDPGDDLDDF
jgi:hypothetical protein